MEIKREGEKAYIYTPYNADFVKKIKTIGGARWSPSRTAWSIPAASIDRCREIMMEIYGESDISSSEKVDVKVTVIREYAEEGRPITLAGIPICRAFSRDSGAIMSDGCDLISGKIGSGGSRAHWDTYIDKDSVFIMHGISKQVAKNIIENASNDSYPWYTAEILESSPVMDVDALREERERLEKRIAEIDAILNKIND